MIENNYKIVLHCGRIYIHKIKSNLNAIIITSLASLQMASFHTDLQSVELIRLP